MIPYFSKISLITAYLFKIKTQRYKPYYNYLISYKLVSNKKIRYNTAHFTI